MAETKNFDPGYIPATQEVPFAKSQGIDAWFGSKVDVVLPSALALYPSQQPLPIKANFNYNYFIVGRVFCQGVADSV